MEIAASRPCLSALALSGLLALVSCGGGGSDTPTQSNPGPTAEGVYGGTLTGSTSNAFELLVLENGEFWSLYGSQAAPINASSVLLVRGFLQGIGTSNNGSFTSSSAKDFGVSPALSGTVSATYDAAVPTISGTANSSQGNVSFSGGAIAGSLYKYDTPAVQSQITGSWSLTSLDGEGISLSLDSAGSFAATSASGCTFSGTALPRSSGKNVFNVSITFGPAPCALAGQPATGIAVVYPLPSGGTQLLVAAIDGSGNYGAAAFGTR